MKRVLYLFGLIVMILTISAFGISANSKIVESPNINIYIDGQLGLYLSNPVVSNGQVYLQLNEYLVKLGIPNDSKYIIYNKSNKTITIKKDKTEISLKVGSKSAVVNKAKKNLEAAPIIYKEKVLIPAKFIAECFGKTYTFDSKTSTLIIGAKPNSAIKQVIVGSAEQLVQQLGSNKRILLRPGTYDFSNITYTDSQDQSITWVSVSDGKELNLNNITNLTIEGPSTVRAEIKNKPRFAEIFSFKNCSNISLINIKAGHTPSEYECNAGVLQFEYCTSILIKNCELYGCGSVGISFYKSKYLDCYGTIIDHCSLRALSISYSDFVVFNNCKIINHEAYSNIVYISDSKNTTFEKCEFSNNNHFEWSFLEVTGESDLFINKCKITRNKQSLSDRCDEKVYLFKTVDFYGLCKSHITVKDSEISYNNCDYLYDNKDAITFINCKLSNNNWK